MSADPPKDTHDHLPRARRGWSRRAAGGRACPSPETQPAAWLLVFEGDSSRRVPLPANGEIIIGRADSCQVAVREAGVSRQHARIWIDGGQALVTDLGSQNGTRVNGGVISGATVLRSGDEISLSNVAIIFHTSPVHLRRDALLDATAFRSRLEAELTRAARYVRPVTVAAVPLGARADRAGLQLALEPAVGRIES